MLWSLKTWHFQNCALVEPIQVPSQEVEKIESFHEIDPAHEPRPLWDRNHTDPLIEEIDDELTQAVRDNPPTDKMVAEEHKKLKWLAIRREEALKIDAATAEVFWSYEQTLDPYGVEPDLPERYQQVGREYFARRPCGEIWVWFGDLPKATQDALWEKHKSSLAFPAGLPHYEDEDVTIEDDAGVVAVHLSESVMQQAAKAAEEKRAELIAKGYARYAENAEQ